MAKAKTLVSSILAAVSFCGFSADVPDLTDSMVDFCSPNVARWAASQPMARAATSMAVHDGLLFTTGGDWNDNLGPCPMFAINPQTGEYSNEWDAGTESVDYFRKGSDGCLYAPSVDPRESHANCCTVSRRNTDGTWKALTISPNRSAGNNAYGVHTWDLAIWKGKIFTAGYGIGVGQEKSETRIADGSPSITEAYRYYKDYWGYNNPYNRRFTAFLPFEDDIFCYPLSYTGTGTQYYLPIGQNGFEEWWYNESTGVFDCHINDFFNVVPGLCRDDFIFRPDAESFLVTLWHPTSFNGRVLYIAGVTDMTPVPFALYSAANVNHSVRATRIDLGSGVFPFDIFDRGGVVTVLAAQYDSSTKKAVNSVWESTDGVNFTKKFTFRAVQHANAIAYANGYYFVSMGARQTVSAAWTFEGTDEVGKIYRIPDPVTPYVPPVIPPVVPPDVVVTNSVPGFAKMAVFTPSSSALAKIGSTEWTDFPVLLRLPSSVSSQLRSSYGTDLCVVDEKGAKLSFEVDEFNPSGTTLVWVKVPTLSSATKLSVYFSGSANSDNDSSDVWSRYAGVWHFAPSAAGSTAIPDATGHGLAGATSGAVSSYDGPAGLGAVQASGSVTAPDYDSHLSNAAQFSASGWFKAPSQADAWWTVASKKVGITTGPSGENLWNIDKGWYLELPQAKEKVNLVYTSVASAGILDTTANWNYFYLVSDGSTVKVYINGSSTASMSVNYAVKASGTGYTMCPEAGCSREYRVRNGVSSAAEAALEYATMADTSFFGMGEIETIAIAPIIGGEGVPAPSFGVNQSGKQVFKFSISNATKGASYRVYRAETLTDDFEPWGDVVEVDAEGVLDFAVETGDANSGFFKVELVQ